MKVLRNWLLELCDLNMVPSVEEISTALTSVGMEIEGVTDLGAGFSGVVVAEVVGIAPHPSSDKLRLVDVITAVGGTPTTVVCGAPNVPEPGGRVLWAQPGATLPGGLTLAVRAVKGVDSPGMLCGEDELGVGDDSSGIVVLEASNRTPLGERAQVALGIDDYLLELNAPANRPDVLGHVGVARELVARLGGRVVLPNTDLTEFVAGTPIGDRLAVSISDTAGCSRYIARLIDGVTVGPSPRWLAQRLRSVGVRPISNLVDITNYVMFEVGQPLHAFDAAKVSGGKVGVRSAFAGETMKTLDGEVRTLGQSDLVIVDGVDGKRAVALAGVMGGADTEVSAQTHSIVLESACFDRRRVRATARRVGLHSESSLRFERGVDPELAELASARAARLMADLGGGRVAPGANDVYPGKAKRTTVGLRRARLAALTGVTFAPEITDGALVRLGCYLTPSASNPDALEVTVPSWRGDLTREADLIEEVLRIAGYDQVPSTIPALRAPNPLFDRDSQRADDARRVLAAAGLAEAITFGFQSFARLEALSLPTSDRRSRPIAVRNPMSADQAIMRTSLLPNLLAAVARNISFGHRDLALFEVGPVFLRRDEHDSDVEPRSLADEVIYVAAVFAGQRPKHLGATAGYDFFDAKGVLDRLIAARTGRETEHTYAHYRAITDVPYLHPGLAASLSFHDQEPAGVVGEIHPDVRANFGIEVPVFAFEVRLGGIAIGDAAQMRPIPRFPGTTRDISLLMADTIPSSRVREIIAAVRQPLVERVDVLEDYRDAKLPTGTKSMLWSVAYRAADRTLTDAELDAAHETLVAQLVTELPAQRRESCKASRR